MAVNRYRADGDAAVLTGADRKDIIFVIIITRQNYWRDVKGM